MLHIADVLQRGTSSGSPFPPSVDAGLGECSADFTINDVENKPVYAAKVKVHIAYGFLECPET